MSLRRELRVAGGFTFGLLGFFLAFVHRGDLLVAPFAVLGAALLLGAVLAIRERPRAGYGILLYDARGNGEPSAP
jgi:hypothetical protein